MGFADDILKFANKAVDKSHAAIIGIRGGVSGALVDITPSDTINPGDGGQAKASWVAATGSPGQSNDSARDKDGSETKAKARQMAAQNLESDFYLTSTCDHIGVLEYGGYPNPPDKGTYLKSGQTKDGVSGPGFHKFSQNGFSPQAPHGMVRVTVANFQNIVNDVVKRLK